MVKTLECLVRLAFERQEIRTREVTFLETSFSTILFLSAVFVVGRLLGVIGNDGEIGMFVCSSLGRLLVFQWASQKFEFWWDHRANYDVI